MGFNPGAASSVTIDLSMLPSSLMGVVPYDLFEAQTLSHSTSTPPFANSWTVEMGAGEFKAFSGFTLGVFAPRLGKKTDCKADDGYRRQATGDTLQACFLECLKDERCENVYIDYID